MQPKHHFLHLNFCFNTKRILVIQAFLPKPTQLKVIVADDVYFQRNVWVKACCDILWSLVEDRLVINSIWNRDIKLQNKQIQHQIDWNKNKSKSETQHREKKSKF